MVVRIALPALIMGLFALSASAETRSYDVKGMTCESCVKSVKGKVCSLPGVESCEVKVGKVTLTGANLDDEAVKAGIDKAGFKVVGVEHADAVGAPDLKPDTHTKKGKGKTR